MGKGSRLGWAVALGTAGCATTPPLDNPVLVRTSPAEIENPVLVSPGTPTGVSYREVFDKCLDVIDDYFEIVAADPYAGKIVTKPRIAPGYEQIWKGGNPDARDRLLATFQTIRQTAAVTIRTGERGGYLIEVVVDKELEDLPRPTRATIGSAVFQEAPTVDRQTDIVGPATTKVNRDWFRIGRDYAFEQMLLCRIRRGE